MNLTFNEISFQPFANNDYVLIEVFSKLIRTFKIANERHGFSHILFPTNLSVIAVKTGVSFYEWVSSLERRHRERILTFASRKPYTNDVLVNQVGDLDAYYFENPVIEQTYCIGLATAYLIGTATISLHTSVIWQNENIFFFKMNDIDGYEPIQVNVLNLFDEDSVNSHGFSQFVEEISTVQLVESNLNPLEKPIHFRDDHGVNILGDFANRLRSCPYVTEVINSLPFNPNTVRFIRKIYSDGKIEIVLHWEDAGYGMVVQTTGRNYKETKAIAEIIEDKYGK